MIPPAWRRFLLRLDAFIRPGAAERELSREIDAHLALIEDEYRSRGLTQAEARVAARRAFGGVELAKERQRDERSFVWFEQLRQDARYACRRLARTPSFTAVAILTLALGIGANTTIFTVAWQTILKPLPYPNPDRLVRVWETFSRGDTPNLVMPGNFNDWRQGARSFQSMAAYPALRGTADFTGLGEPEQWRVRHVTDGYFDVFGTSPLAGRVFAAREVELSSHVAVISERTWRRRFGGDTGILGRDIRLDGAPWTIIGVMPSEFAVAAGDVDAWLPFVVPPDKPGERLRAHYLGVVARLAPDVNVARATAAVKAIAARAEKLYPEANRGLSAKVESLQSQRAVNLRSGLVLLALSAGLVLLIACANLASLQLARSLSRGPELGIRAALGANRSRLLAQLLTESLVLAALGSAVGLTLGAWMLRALATVASEEVRRAAAAGLDGTVVLYGGGLAIVSVALFASLPAWRSSSSASKWLSQRVATGDRVAARARTGLVAVQVALAVMLVVAASVLVSSLLRVLQVDPGFNRHDVLTFDIGVRDTRLDTFAKREALLRDIMERARALPGVAAVCAMNEVPFDNGGVGMTYVPEGQSQPIGAAPRTVTSGCFTVLGIRLVRGRIFEPTERGRVGIVTESFARAAWPGENPIGRRVHLGMRDGTLIEIVGVVTDSLQSSLEGRAFPQFYEFASQAAGFWPTKVLLRASVPPTSLFASVRTAVRSVDPGQTVARLRTLDEAVTESLSKRRFVLALVSGFAFIALILVFVGMYGLLMQTVAQREAEIGIRIALGATEASAVRLVMNNAWLAVSLGVAAGVCGAVGASRLLRSLVFGVSPTMPGLYAAAAGGLAAVTLGVAWLAARRAARVDPLTALKG